MKYFREYHDGTISSLKSLKARRDELTHQRDIQSRTVRDLREKHKELRTVCANVEAILQIKPPTKEMEQIKSNTLRKNTRNREPEIS